MGGKKVNGQWNTAAHRDRIVEIGEPQLRIMSEAFGNGEDWEGISLASIQANENLDVLGDVAEFPKHIRDYNTRITVALNETTDVDKGVIRRENKLPDLSKCELIYSGPHIGLCNPIVKSPRPICLLNSDYDVVSLSTIDEDFVPRTNYVPNIPVNKFKDYFQGLSIGQNSDGNEQFDTWTDHYRCGFREFVGPDSERTLVAAILPRDCAHINTITSVAFHKNTDVVELTGLSSSIPVDFYVKMMDVSHINPNRVVKLPLGISDEFKPALFVRTLQLNCLTKYYADLWQELWQDEYKSEQWSLDDPRLKPFDTLTKEWQWATPLRNYFERRQALVEIDVIAAMALGLTLKDLEMIYNIQFPVLQQNEADAWYDQKGNIVFTVSKGLTGVGCDRKEWETIRGKLYSDGLTYDGDGKEYVHTIDPKKSELYGGQQVTYYPPYTKCDRIADYRRAWAFFEKWFNSEN